MSLTVCRWPVRLGWLAALALLAAPAPVSAQRSLAIERFDASLTVHPSGIIDVTESIRVRFRGRWNGIYRTIPVEYRTPQDLNYHLDLRIASVTDEAGQPLEYESSRARAYRRVQIWVPGAEDTARTVIIRYEVRNGLRFFDQHDELYWNVTGDEWDAVIESATARVSLPEVTGLRATAFTGVYGSRDSAASVTADATEVRVQSTRPLEFRQGLTIVVGWDPGTVKRPSAADTALRIVRANLTLAIPLLALPVMWRIWSRYGRDPRGRPTTVQYEPPAELRPAEVGTLVDNSPDMRDITATLVDLAVRGLITIEEIEDRGWRGLFGRTDYRFLLRKPWGDEADLRTFERRLLAGLFPAVHPAAGTERDSPDAAPLASVDVSSLKNSFYTKLPGIRDALFGELMRRHHYLRRPDRVRKAFLIGAAVVGVAVGVLGATVNDWMGVDSVAPLLAGIATGLVVAGFGWFMPARTAAGTRALERALGFEEFLRRVEDDRLDRMARTPEMFERYLPFAMALGVEERWAQAFEGIATEPPRWYRGRGVGQFSSGHLGSSMSRMSAVTGSTLSSSPRSSGGSGFSGGSSGGGFGGGGGGGF